MNQLANAAVRLDSDAKSGLRRAWLEPLLLACALAVWFGYELGSRALWSPDEGRYAEIPREMVATGDYLTPRLNGVKYFEKPPLVYWLEAAATKAFGVDEWALRLWPAAFALLGCLTVYFLGLRFYGARAGLFAAIVLACSPLYDFLGGALTLDMPFTALLTIALGAFMVGVLEPPGIRRRLWMYGFYAATALAVLAKGLAAIVIPALVIGAWIAILAEWRLLRAIYLPTGALVFFAVAAPWHVLAALANPEFAQFYFIHEHFDRYVTTVHQRYEPIWFFVPVLLAGMYPWSALLPHALRDAFACLWRERRQRRDTWLLLLWAGLPFLFFSFSSSKLTPYILPVLPPLALLLGCFLARAWDGSTAPARAALWLLFALGIAFAALLAALPQLLPNSQSVMSAAAQLGGARYTLAAVCLLAGAAPLIASFCGNGRTSTIALCAVGALLVLTFDLTLSRLDVGRSVKPLALALKHELGPDDEVMTYQAYYQDLPVYLERRITIVDWSGELEFGASVEDTSAWMINTPELRRRWREARTIYLLTSPGNVEKLRAGVLAPICLMRSSARVAVIVNRECQA